MCSVCMVLKHLTPFADIQEPPPSPVAEAGLSRSHSEMVLKGRGVPLAGKGLNNKRRVGVNMYITTCM